MNDINFEIPNQNFNQPKKSNTGRNVTLLTCGGITAAIFLCCCCCLVGFYFLLRQPVAAVTFWGTFMTQADGYDLAQEFVCDGSQAEDVTNDLADRNAVFTSFQTLGDGTGDVIDATANGTIDGESTTWEATFYVVEGGSFPISNCIDRIEVTSE